MKPKDFETFVGLQQAVTEANEALENFENREVELVPGLEGESITKRVEALWDTLISLVPEDKTTTFPGYNDSYFGSTKYVEVVVDEESGKTYALDFLVKRAKAIGGREVTARWAKCMPDGTFEEVGEENLKLDMFLADRQVQYPRHNNPKRLNELADLEWSLSAFLEASGVEVRQSLLPAGSVDISKSALLVALSHIRAGKEASIDGQDWEAAATWRDNEKNIVRALGGRGLAQPED